MKNRLLPKQNLSNFVNSKTHGSFFMSKLLIAPVYNQNRSPNPNHK